ncbi:hypothetical protein IFM89_031922 [Coptis chinensis]|uniref:Malectin-like domain-containing protein n=1 Tax=Coptis chinensis TaxID=261450 RepID=A0A835IT07_9MAGN|nr:hypothetical protein IFM89_031922 [Coptis chinensis]
MSLSLLLLWLVTMPFSIHALPDQRGYYINCGASKETTVDNLKWLTDEGFINVGNKTTIGTPDLIPILATLRYFPEIANKYCYEVPANKGGKYMVRTTYYYGGFDGGKEPPVFDQIIEGTKWGTVNTTEDYLNGHTSYYEIIVVAKRNRLSVCLARNKYTVSHPFISTLEIVYLEDSMYTSTDFNKHSLSTVARHCFGYTGELLRFPDDQFNRYWQPFADANPNVTSKSNVTSSKFWNLPPAKVFETGIDTSRNKTLDVQWPAVSLHSSNYYIALYFQDNRSPSDRSWRIFDVYVNKNIFYKALNVSTSGVTVFSKQWPLSGKTVISLLPANLQSVGPIINAGEILEIVPNGKRTVTRDVVAMEEIAKRLDNPPVDWRGDPCLPTENAWTGITCSQGKMSESQLCEFCNVKLDREDIEGRNLTGLGLSGSMSPSIDKLTALTSLWLGGNKLSGPIPNLTRLLALASLHLENNQLNGTVPASFGKLSSLRELYLQNNNLEGPFLIMLEKRNGLDLQ